MKLKTLTGSLLALSSISFAEEAPNIDRIDVVGRVPAYQKALSNVLPQPYVLDETSFSSDSLATLLSQSPAINLNGQGGLFQTINIRGFARWRIQTLVEGIPIYTERRAGTAVEFLPPTFIGQAYITPGAASTQLGSGAMGGGIDLSLKQPKATELALGYGYQQNYKDINLQSSDDDGLSWLLNHRHANNSDDAAGNQIQDGYEHTSIALRKRTDDSVIKETLLLYSYANDIAKASSDLPEDRFTLYPKNAHFLGKVIFDWHNLAVYFHDASLKTDVTRSGRRTNLLTNDALDIGVQLNDEFMLGDWSLHWRAGIDARTGVNAFERELDSNEREVFANTILDAKQMESFIAIDASVPTKTGTLVGGSRLAYQYQQDDISDDSQGDLNSSMFIGYAIPLNAAWKVSGYASTAYRVPSLTERYFNGSTPRGRVIGDVDLATETASNVDLNIQFQQGNFSSSVSLFQQNIDDYIERMTLSDELRQYRNLDSARIRGVNYQLEHTSTMAGLDLRVQLGGQWLTGEDQADNPLADITPAQHRFSLSISANKALGFIAVTHRQSSDDELAGELPVASVTTIDVGYSYQLNEATALQINLTNLTDRLYVTSRDDLAPFARGRDINISVRYRM
jgi:iron complex outermembrane receptor protein